MVKLVRPKLSALSTLWAGCLVLVVGLLTLAPHSLTQAAGAGHDHAAMMQMAAMAGQNPDMPLPNDMAQTGAGMGACITYCVGAPVAFDQVLGAAQLAFASFDFWPLQDPQPRFVQIDLPERPPKFA